MKKLTILIGAFTVLAAPAYAAEDPVAARKALMRNNSAAAAVSNAMIGGDIEYNPLIGRAAIAALGATAATLADYFPESSGPGEGTRAAPQIWEDRDGFLAVLGGFQTATAAALAASGSDGPPDAEAFAAAVQPVLEFCGACHSAYRVQQ